MGEVVGSPVLGLNHWVDMLPGGVSVLFLELDEKGLDNCLEPTKPIPSSFFENFQNWKPCIVNGVTSQFGSNVLVSKYGNTPLNSSFYGNSKSLSVRGDSTWHNLRSRSRPNATQIHPAVGQGGPGLKILNLHRSWPCTWTKGESLYLSACSATLTVVWKRNKELLSFLVIRVNWICDLARIGNNANDIVMKNRNLISISGHLCKKTTSLLGMITQTLNCT